MADPSTDE